MSRILAPASTFQQPQRLARSSSRVQAEPNANTSGLPAPSKARARGPTSAQIPSTVGNALRRRPTPNDTPLSSFGLRPAPPPRLPVAAPARLEPEPELEDRQVESLPPLKSTSYLSRLARTSTDHSLSEAKSEPDRKSKRAEKPSQLVRPLVSPTAKAKALPVPLKYNLGSRAGPEKAAGSANWAPAESDPESSSTRLDELAGANEGADTDEDDDATTADSLTQTTSESTNLTLASQELSNMINMLSSSAILADSESQARQDASAKLDRTPRRKSLAAPKLLKSQSLSFDQRNGQPLLARPRSRIIFDPTSSQFHISPAGRAPEEQASLASGTSLDSSASSSSSTSAGPGDRSAQLLLDTREQIYGLKSLPSEPLEPGAGQLAGGSESGARGERAPLPPAVRRRSPVGSALRSLFGSSRHSSAASSAGSCPEASGEARSPRRLATVIRHGSLRCPEAAERKLSFGAATRAASPPAASASRESSASRYANLGSDLLQRASKRLSASSSSLTSRFKFISTPSASSVHSSASTDGDAVGKTAGSAQKSSQAWLRAPNSVQVSHFSCRTVA